MARDTSLNSGNQQVFQPDVGERPAHHDAVVATPRAIGVEIVFGDSPLQKETPGRTVFGDVARWRDVVCCNRIADHHQDPRTANFPSRRRLTAEADKKRRLLDIG